ncbi:MAG: hypothetical protein ABIQ77_04175 [Anaerolineales bacterium]
MAIHSIPQIGSVLRNAVTFNFKNPSEVLMRAEFIPTQVRQFFNLLESRKIEYVLVNGIALLTYVDGRNTQDIDLIMALPSLAKLPEIKIESQDVFFARGKFGELQIDILLTKNPLFAKVEKDYTTTRQFMDRRISCATVDGLILLKLFALPSLYRQACPEPCRRDGFERVRIYENDIATLINAFNPKMQPLLKELSRHLNADDMAEAQKIVSDIEARIQRFRKANK